MFGGLMILMSWIWGSKLGMPKIYPLRLNDKFCEKIADAHHLPFEKSATGCFLKLCGMKSRPIFPTGISWRTDKGQSCGKVCFKCVCASCFCSKMEMSLVKIVGLPQYPFLDTTLPHCCDSNSKTLTVLAQGKAQIQQLQMLSLWPGFRGKKQFRWCRSNFGLFNPNNGI